jgi:hypothetical protein
MQCICDRGNKSTGRTSAVVSMGAPGQPRAARAAACCCRQTVGGGGGDARSRPPLAPRASRALPIARRRARGSTDCCPLSAALQAASATLPLCLSDSDCGWGGALPMRPQPLCVAGSGMLAAGTWPGTEQHNPSAAHRPQSRRDSDTMVCPFSSPAVRPQREQNSQRRQTNTCKIRDEEWISEGKRDLRGLLCLRLGLSPPRRWVTSMGSLPS